MAAFTGTHTLKIDWDNNGNFTGTYDDVLPDLIGTIRSRIGIQSTAPGSDRIAPTGTLTFTLDNSWFNQHNEFGLYSPENSGGSLYGNLLPRRPVIWQVNYSATDYDKFTGYIKSIEPNPQDHTVRITCEDEMSRLIRPTVGITLQTDQTAQQVATTILTAVGTFTTSFDSGAQTLPYVGDTWPYGMVSAYNALRDLALAEWGRVWAQADGTLEFWNSWHEFGNLSSQATLTGTMVGLDVEYEDSNIYNNIEVSFTPRAVGSSGTVLATLQGVPIRFQAGETKTLILRYRDPTGGAQVAASAVNALTATTDYLPASGFTITPTYTSNSVSMEVENTSGKNLNLTFLQQRGTPLYSYDRATVQEQDSTSIAAYETRTLPLNLRVGGSARYASYLARHLLGLYKDPHTFVRNLRVSNLSSAQYTAQLSLKLGQVITLTQTDIGYSGGLFLILGISDEVEGARHMTTYIVSPYNYPQYLIVGVGKVGVNAVGPF